MLMYLVHIPEAYLYRICILLTINLVSAFHAALVINRCKWHWQRTCAATPVLVSNCLSPLLFKDDSEAISKAVIFMCCIWVFNFKVLALCLNRGSFARPWTTLQIAAAYLLPITPCNQLPGVLSSQVILMLCLAFSCFCNHYPMIADNCRRHPSKVPPHTSKSSTAARILVFKRWDMSPLRTHILYGTASLTPFL